MPCRAGSPGDAALFNAGRGQASRTRASVTAGYRELPTAISDASAFDGDALDIHVRW